MKAFPLEGLRGHGPLLLQGWFPEQAVALAGALSEGGALGMLRVPAFPDLSELESRLDQAGRVGLDLKGQLSHFAEVVALAAKRKLPFLAHGPELAPELRDRLRACGLFRMAFVDSPEQAVQAAQDGAGALVVSEGPDPSERLPAFHRQTGLPLLAEAGPDPVQAQALLALEGVAGLQVRGPALLRELAPPLKDLPKTLAGDDRSTLPPLQIGAHRLVHPIVQGGMGLGVSWEGLAGAVAHTGCLGIVSAIGTGYRNPERTPMRLGRADGATGLHCTHSLQEILDRARRIAAGRGAVGVNILCAINGYEDAVRASVEGGAQVIISGAGLPLSLPSYVDEPSVALVPIVSSPRALSLICKTWERKFKRLPDAVVLEGPESGGHQGFSLEQCLDPAFALDRLLPGVVEERNKWGHFPVIAAGGIWDRKDIDLLLALGAGGVQMATRFIGTLECDAALAFKEVLLRARREDIQLVKSPVGMPGRAVLTDLQRRVQEGTAPLVRCVSDCVSPCERGKGAREAGYCIADCLEDARQGKLDSGLFFTGSNGWKLRELVSVRELVAEISGDF